MQNKIIICSRCIMDTTAPFIKFDENGVCNYCKLHDQLEQRFPLNQSSIDQLNSIISDIKKKGKNKNYDCIVGFSGGVDSSYCLYLAKKWGLRPLAVHLDNGWNSDIAINNIKKIVKKLEVDLKIINVDWEEFKDMQIAHLKASIPDTENPTDVAIYSTLYKTAAEEGVKYVIHGHSFRNEGTAPIGWMYMDGKYIESVMKQYGTNKKLKNYNNLKIMNLIYYAIIKRIKEVRPLEYLPYNKNEAAEMMKTEFGWENYGGLHYESIYTRFNTVYTLYKKFNIDFRKIQYSAFIRTVKMKREEAILKIKEPPMSEEKIKDDLKYVLEKLGIEKKEFDEIMARPPKSFMDYPNYYRTIRKLKYPIKIACSLKLLPAIVYEKYAK